MQYIDRMGMIDKDNLHFFVLCDFSTYTVTESNCTL